MAYGPEAEYTHSGRLEVLLARSRVKNQQLQEELEKLTLQNDALEKLTHQDGFRRSSSDLHPALYHGSMPRTPGGTLLAADTPYTTATRPYYPARYVTDLEPGYMPSEVYETATQDSGSTLSTVSDISTQITPRVPIVYITPNLSAVSDRLVPYVPTVVTSVPSGTVFSSSLEEALWTLEAEDEESVMPKGKGGRFVKRPGKGIAQKGLQDSRWTSPGRRNSGPDPLRGRPTGRASGRTSTTAGRTGGRQQPRQSSAFQYQSPYSQKQLATSSGNNTNKATGLNRPPNKRSSSKGETGQRRGAPVRRRSTSGQSPRVPSPGDDHLRYLCPAWAGSFSTFLQDVAPSWPGPNFTLQPLGNDPELKLGNCQWVELPLGSQGSEVVGLLDSDRSSSNRHLFGLWRRLREADP